MAEINPRDDPEPPVPAEQRTIGAPDVKHWLTDAMNRPEVSDQRHLIKTIDRRCR